MKIHRLLPRKMVKAWVRQQETWASSSGISPWQAKLVFCWGLHSSDLVSVAFLRSVSPYAEGVTREERAWCVLTGDAGARLTARGTACCSLARWLCLPEVSWDGEGGARAVQAAATSSRPWLMTLTMYSSELPLALYTELIWIGALWTAGA